MTVMISQHKVTNTSERDRYGNLVLRLIYCVSLSRSVIGNEIVHLSTESFGETT